ADAVGLLERDLLAAREVQLVAVVEVVAVEAPAMLFAVLEDDLLVRDLELALARVHGQVGVVALRAGEDALREGRLRDLGALRCGFGRGRGADRGEQRALLVGAAVAARAADRAGRRREGGAGGDLRDPGGAHAGPPVTCRPPCTRRSRTCAW